MEPVQLWTGRTACALQTALRMTNESFAAHLGTAVRTVATWHQKPDRVPSSEMQQALDTTLERAGEGAQARFTRNIAETGVRLSPPSPPFDNPAHTAEDVSAAVQDDLTATASPAIITGTAEDTGNGDFMGWLQVAHAALAPPDGSDVGQIIRWYRTYEGLTQQDAAVVLNTTQSRLSKLENGTQALRDVKELRHIAKKFGIPPERLGVLPDHSADARPFASHVSDRPGPIRDSQERWRDIRCQLNAHRAVLGDLAAELYPAQLRIFSLWRNIQREFSEEFLGNDEHDGNSVDPISYDTDEPFVSFERARQAGDFRVFACAMVLEPLTLWVELLTVAVIAAPVFDALFSGMVAVNEEGAAVSTEADRPTVGIPFTAEARERLRTEPLSPISRACVELAWQYRHQLLGP